MCAGRIDSPLPSLHAWLTHLGAKQHLLRSLDAQIAALNSTECRPRSRATAGEPSPMEVDEAPTEQQMQQQEGAPASSSSS